MEFKDKLKKLRLQENYTQKELAEKIYVSRSAVAKWENGLGIPSEESIKDLCNLFNVNEDELLGKDIEEKVEKNKKISKQRIFIISLGSALLLAIIVIVLSISININTKKNNKSEILIYKPPVISLSNNNDYYTEDVYISTDYIVSSVLEIPNKNVIENLIQLPVHERLEMYEIQYNYDVKEIIVSYFYLTEDNLIIMKQNSVNKMVANNSKMGRMYWYGPGVYAYSVEVIDNKFSIPEDEYKETRLPAKSIIIEININVDDIYYTYYFMYVI